MRWNSRARPISDQGHSRTVEGLNPLRVRRPSSQTGQSRARWSADGAGVGAGDQQESGVRTTVYETSHDPLCRMLRKALVEVVQAGPGSAGMIGSVLCRSVATLYTLLLDHPIDRRGRCRSCRRPGAVFGSRWRHCRVYGEANLWLWQLDEALLQRLLAHELGLAAAPPPAAPGGAPARNPDDTDVLPAITADPPAQSLQTPAVPPLRRDSRN